MATEIDWVNDSPEYREALSALADAVREHARSESLSHDQGISLLVRLSAELCAALFDTERYMTKDLLEMVFGDDVQCVLSQKEIDKIPTFVDVQAERFRYILENAISRSYDVDVSKIRRRLDS